MVTQTGVLSIDRSLSRRRLMQGSALLAGGLLVPRGLVAAAQSSSGSDAAAANVTFRVTKETIDGPAKIASGINRVAVENQTGQDEVHVLTMQLPAGVTRQTLEQFFASLSPNDDAPPPAWWLKATMVGNPDWPVAGGVSDGYIDYPAGTYAIMNIFGSQWTTFTVEKAATDTAPPKADIAVETKLMTFTGLDDGVSAGRHLWKVTNSDMVAHEMAFMKVPSASTTVDEIIKALTSSQDLTTLPKGYASLPGGTGILTPSVSMWLYVDLAPGNYAAVCFAPDGWTGPPHALMGMIKVFTVK